ncbi:MAG: pentapeptide repeat-containing protein, partial [Gemmatimonadota bacterium]|nr:pentapeptide repeat-containing protein [Gemmatimonadota bacterium]
MEDTAKSQADAVLKTEQGQRQDRLKNAIEHLGDKSDSVRLGGAYELFHLAQDTEDLRQTVLDILCAHIRRTTSESEYRETHKSKPSEEIQSLLTLLFVQKHEVFKDCHINLQGSWLNGADLKEARLWKARLTQVYLQGTELDRAHLQRANLVAAYLEEASLRKAQLQDADLRFTRLQGATLNKTRLQGANLREAQLQGAFLVETQLQGAFLVDTRLQGAALNRAHLQGAMLHLMVQLQGAVLQGARLQGIGNVDGASISFQDRIRGKIDKESDLSGVIFAGGLSQEYVDSLVGGLSDDQAKRLQGRLRRHIDTPESYELPENSGAITGTYTEEDAEKWISEYNKAMSFVPKKAGN